MVENPKVGDKVRLNDHGLSQMFQSALGLSVMKEKVFTLTAVDPMSMTEPELTFMVEVDDPDVNHFMIDNWCFDPVLLPVVTLNPESGPKTCKSCTYWQDPASYTAENMCNPTDPDTFKPMKFEFQVKECRHISMTKFERPTEANGWGLCDGSEYKAIMVTGEDYGCLRHSDLE